MKRRILDFHIPTGHRYTIIPPKDGGAGDGYDVTVPPWGGGERWQQTILALKQQQFQKKKKFSSAPSISCIFQAKLMVPPRGGGET